MTHSIAVDPMEGYCLWSADYDAAPNPLLALEMRAVSGRLNVPPGARVLDAGSGTGRWMSWAQSRGAHVFGIDLCPEMLRQAERKPGLAGRSALADISSVPFMDDAMDVALCSFTIGYVKSPARVFRELARVAREVVVSDMHPIAARAGWTRSFRRGDRVYDLAHHNHSISGMDMCAHEAGLVRRWRMEVSFGEPERAIFRSAGKESTFDKVRLLPAVLITSWRK